MPEGDSIFRAAQTLHRALAGSTVTRFTSVFPHLTRIDADAPLRSRTVLNVMDGLRGVWHAGPFSTDKRYRFYPKQMKFGTDPVAIDRFLIDVVDDGFAHVEVAINDQPIGSRGSHSVEWGIVDKVQDFVSEQLEYGEPWPPCPATGTHPMNFDTPSKAWRCEQHQVEVPLGSLNG